MDTVQRLAEILRKERVVHIRGTPASGKSYLAWHLRDYYLDQEPPVPAVLLRSWPREGAKPNAEQYLTSQANAHKLYFESRNLLKQNIVFILDEGQQSYDDDDLWPIIKFQSSRSVGPQFCILTSYGSPASGPEPTQANSPTVFLHVRQRISILPSRVEGSPDIALFFNKMELEDVVRRFCDAPGNYLRVSSATEDYIFDLTQGQPGPVGVMLRMLEEVRLSHVLVLR